jgi:hypothetical protein
LHHTAGFIRRKWKLSQTFLNVLAVFLEDFFRFFNGIDVVRWRFEVFVELLQVLHEGKVGSASFARAFELEVVEEELLPVITSRESEVGSKIGELLVIFIH